MKKINTKMLIEQEKVQVISDNFIMKEHFHINAEVFLISEGRCSIIVNGVMREVGAGDICFFESYHSHGYDKMITKLNARIVKIPYTLLEDYYVLKADRQLSSNIITNRHLCNYLIELTDKFLTPYTSTVVKNSTARLIVAILTEKLHFTDVKDKNETELIRKILAYLTLHFREKLSLSQIAKNLGYAEEHVSRIFHKYLNMGIPEYVNSLRFRYVEGQLKQGRKGLQEIVFESGFGSLQTYYRFKAKTKKNDKFLNDYNNATSFTNKTI